MSWHIRWGIRRDLPEMVAIDNYYFACPWGEDKFVEVLRKRNHISMVATRNEDLEDVDGFMVYELGGNYIKVINFAVAPTALRQGLGSQMMAKLKSKLAPKRRRHLDFRVRSCISSERGQPAVGFFNHHDFVYMPRTRLLRWSLPRTNISIPFDTNALLDAFWETPTQFRRRFEAAVERTSARDVEDSARASLNNMLSNGPIEPIPGGITRDVLQQAMDIMRTR